MLRAGRAVTHSHGGGRCAFKLIDPVTAGGGPARWPAVRSRQLLRRRRVGSLARHPAGVDGNYARGLILSGLRRDARPAQRSEWSWSPSAIIHPGDGRGPGAAPPDPAAQSARHTRNQEIGFPGERAGGQFIAFWLRGGRAAAGMNASVWDMNEHVQALARSRQASGWLRWPIPAPAWRAGRRACG
jgi:hypothetical protein